MAGEKIKELALSDLGNSLLLLIEDIKELNISLIRKQVILDSQILALTAVREALAQELTELRNERIQFRADSQICARLNLLWVPKNSGELPKNQETKGPPQDDNEETDLEKKLTHWN